jgi:hypothetical protein
VGRDLPTGRDVPTEWNRNDRAARQLVADCIPIEDPEDQAEGRGEEKPSDALATLTAATRRRLLREMAPFLTARHCQAPFQECRRAILRALPHDNSRAERLAIVN